MSTQESDGVDEALQGVTQVAMTMAARVGEQMARAREQQARQAQAGSEQAARENAARMTAEREAARAALATVHRPQWWDSATAEDVTKAYTTATAWRGVDQEAVRAEQRITDEVRGRYGIDLTRGAEPAEVAEAIERAHRTRGLTDEERTDATGDRAEAAALLATADATDRAAEGNQRAREAAANPDNQRPMTFPEAREWAVENKRDDLLQGFSTDMRDVDTSDGRRSAQRGFVRAVEGARASELREDAGPAYDSAERREAMAASLDHLGNPAVVDARMRSDVAQGRPATEAVTSSPARTPKARKTKGRAQAARAAHRNDRSR